MGLRVLIIDDDQVQLTLFERSWSRLRPDWHITTQHAAASFDGSLPESLAAGFDLVVLDERLGSQQQGSACAGTVARQCLVEGGVLVLMSGSPESVAATGDAVAAVIGKPFSLAETEDFLLALERVLAGSTEASEDEPA